MSLSPWLTDAPYDDNLISRFNRLTHFPKDRAVENQRFAASARAVEHATMQRLCRAGVEGMPDGVRAALDNMRRAEYDWFCRWVRARELAPPWSVVGPANYHKFARPRKADRCVKIGFEGLDAAKERLERAIKRHCKDDNRISSDDPEALLKLDDRIAELEQLQEMMKAVNKTIRAKGTEDEKVADLLDLGLDEETARQRIQGMRYGSMQNLPGYRPYELSNNNANITRLKERRKHLEEMRNDSPQRATFPGGVVRDNVAENRLQIEFDAKPSADVRDKLKENSFNWSPSRGVWQRMRGNYAIAAAERALGLSLTFETDTDAE